MFHVAVVARKGTCTTNVAELFLPFIKLYITGPVVKHRLRVNDVQ